MKDFKGKNGFITGAASGIGRSLAIELAEGFKYSAEGFKYSDKIKPSVIFKPKAK